MRNVQTGLRESLRKVYEEYSSGRAPQIMAKSAAQRGSLQETAQASAVVPLYSVQNIVRPLFGKGDPHLPSIGDHPGFVHLDGTNRQEFCAVSTLFMDIENSTRMGVVFGPEEAYRRKNAIVCMAIEIIKTFDGHVHRIMGDAVMAYFGGPDTDPHTAAIDALNCAAFLRYFFGSVILPQLNGGNEEDSVGIRIGLDHGPRDHVLWASYGYAGMSEVTATSFYVDVASKLQGQAGFNRVLIGQSLKEFLDFPDELLEVPTRSRDGEKELDPYIRPNYTRPDGSRMNYRKYRLKWERYLAGSHVAIADAPAFFPGESQPVPFVIVAGLCTGNGAAAHAPYAAESSPLAKDSWLRFEVLQGSPLLIPERIRISVENHGREAAAANQLKRPGEWTSIRKPVTSSLAVRYEGTAFRGLHDLVVDVGYANGVTRTRRFGVYIA